MCALCTYVSLWRWKLERLNCAWDRRGEWSKFKLCNLCARRKLHANRRLWWGTNYSLHSIDRAICDILNLQIIILTAECSINNWRKRGTAVIAGGHLIVNSTTTPSPCTMHVVKMWNAFAICVIRKMVNFCQLNENRREKNTNFIHFFKFTFWCTSSWLVRSNWLSRAAPVRCSDVKCRTQKFCCLRFLAFVMICYRSHCEATVVSWVRYWRLRTHNRRSESIWSTECLYFYLTFRRAQIKQQNKNETQSWTGVQWQWHADSVQKLRIESVKVAALRIGTFTFASLRR